MEPVDLEVVHYYVQNKDAPLQQKSVEDFISSMNLGFMKDTVTPWLNKIANDAMVEKLDKIDEVYTNFPEQFSGNNYVESVKGIEAEEHFDDEYYSDWMGQLFSFDTGYLGDEPLRKAKQMLANSKYKTYDVFEITDYETMETREVIEFLKYVNNGDVNGLFELLSNGEEIDHIPKQITGELAEGLKTTTFEASLIYRNESLKPIIMKTKFRPGSGHHLTILIDFVGLTDTLSEETSPVAAAMRIQNRLDNMKTDKSLQETFYLFCGEIVSQEMIN